MEPPPNSLTRQFKHYYISLTEQKPVAAWSAVSVAELERLAEVRRLGHVPPSSTLTCRGATGGRAGQMTAPSRHSSVVGRRVVRRRSRYPLRRLTVSHVDRQNHRPAARTVDRQLDRCADWHQPISDVYVG